MLQVILAGLVRGSLLTLEEAEYLYKRLKNKKVPDSVKECLEMIEHPEATKR